MPLATATLVRPATLTYRTAPSCSDGERAHHAERGQVDALELQAGLADGGDEALDHLAADGDDDDARARAGGRVTTPSGWKSRIASSIGIGMWSGASRRTAAASAFGRRPRRQVERADDDALVGDAEAHRLGSSCSAKSLQRLGERADVGDLAVAQDAGRSWATAPRVRVMEPLTLTSAAARWPGSSSRPTTLALGERFFGTRGCIGTGACRAP